MPKANITEAQIARAIKAARKAGETVYGYVVDGAKVIVHTRPLAPSAGPQSEQLDGKWFDDED